LLQALLKNLRHLRLAQTTKEKPLLMDIYNQCRALPLLPASQIEEAFKDIAKLDINNELKPFLVYVENQWIKKVR
jgi:hypothetical protein